MSTMDERKFRDLYDTQCDVIDAIAEALHAHGLPNDVVIERAREMTIRAHSAEGQRDSARRLIDIARDHHDREVRELRAELDVVRSRLMTATVERDTLRRVYTAANDWLTHLGEKGHRYNDGVPGELMDAVDAVATLRSGKL